VCTETWLSVPVHLDWLGWSRDFTYLCLRNSGDLQSLPAGLIALVRDTLLSLHCSQCWPTDGYRGSTV